MLSQQHIRVQSNYGSGKVSIDWQASIPPNELKIILKNNKTKWTSHNCWLLVKKDVSIVSEIIPSLSAKTEPKFELFSCRSESKNCRPWGSSCKTNRIFVNRLLTNKWNVHMFMDQICTIQVRLGGKKPHTTQEIHQANLQRFMANLGERQTHKKRKKLNKNVWLDEFNCGYFGLQRPNFHISKV